MELEEEVTCRGQVCQVPRLRVQRAFWAWQVFSSLRPRMVWEAERSRGERASGWKLEGSFAETIFPPLTLGCAICNCKMNTLAPLSTEHVEGHGVPAMRRGFWVLRRQSCICSLSACPYGWLSQAGGPLVSKTIFIRTWSPLSLKTQTLLASGRATLDSDPLPSNRVVIISARTVNSQHD